MIFYVGDIHGDAATFAKVDQEAHRKGAVAIVQCGDFGYYWPGHYKLQQYFEKRVRQNKLNHPVYFVDGNHEQFPKLDFDWEEQGQPDVVELAKNVFHVRRGAFVELDGIGHVFCGGANSTDRFRRVEGESWWPDEEPTAADYTRFYDTIQLMKPEVIVTHEAPQIVPLYKTRRYEDTVSHNLQRVFTLSEHRPARWYFGHHHIVGTWKVDEITTFFATGWRGEFCVGPSADPKA